MKFYRFRSLDNLLGKYKELENQEIYFASPSEQNDPMEGYHEVYFQGDEIVWTNLLKNYLFLLDQVTQDILLSEPRRKYKEPDNLDLFYVWNDLPSQLKSHLEKIFDSFLSKEYINQLILNLSQNERKFSWQDIRYYLKSIHLIAISTIHEIYRQSNIPIFNTLNIDLDNINQFNEEYFSLLDQIPEEQRSLLFQGINLVSDQLDLIHKLTLKKFTSKKQFLLQEFPYFFLEKIKKLMHRDWYTACFMNEESSHSSSVWGSYGSNHTGICLIFQADAREENYYLALNQPISFDSKDGINYEFQSSKYYSIDYTRFPSPINFFTSLGQLPTPQLVNNWLRSTDGKLSNLHHSIYSNIESWRDKYHKNFLNNITRKSKDWKYENEYRLIYSSMLHDCSEKKTRKFKYEFSSLDGLVFGINTPQAKKIEIIKIIKQKCYAHRRTEFNFYQAEFCHNTQSIKHMPLSLIKFKF